MYVVKASQEEKPLDKPYYLQRYEGKYLEWGKQISIATTFNTKAEAAFVLAIAKQTTPQDPFTLEVVECSNMKQE